MFRTVAIIIAVIFILLAIFGGTTWLFSHVRAFGGEIRDGIDEISTDAHEAARIRVLLSDLDRKVLKFQDKLSDIMESADAADRNAARNKTKLDAEKGLLARAKEMLDQGKKTYRIGQRIWSREQLNKDALARLAICKKLAEGVEFSQNLSSKLRAAIVEGKTNLSNAREARREKAAHLQTLEIRLKNAKLLYQVNDLVKGLHESPLGPSTELGKAMDSFEKRARRMERRADYLSDENKEGLIIDWSGTAEGGKEASEAIGDFLKSVNSEPTAPSVDPQQNSIDFGN